MSGLQREGYAPEWVEYERSLTGPLIPPASDGDIVAAFHDLLTKNATTFPPPPEGVTTRDEKVDDNVIVRIYQPPRESNSNPEPRPAVVFYHGGGWAAGDLDTEDHFCRSICGRGDVVVISVLYRKFPAVKFPQNMQDSYAGFQWAHQHADTLGADRKRFMAMGGSAGGLLAIAIVHKLVQEGQGDRVAGLLTLSSSHMHPDAVPSEYQHLHTSMQDNSGPIPFVTADMAIGALNLLGGEPPYGDESKHWFPVSMGVEGVRGFPPTWILDSEKDCMRDDGRVLQAELDDAGIRVKREVVKGMPHYYWTFPLQEAAEDFKQRVLGGLKWILNE